MFGMEKVFLNKSVCQNGFVYITLCINFYSKEKEDKSFQPNVQNILCTCMYNP